MFLFIICFAVFVVDDLLLSSLIMLLLLLFCLSEIVKFTRCIGLMNVIKWLVIHLSKI